MPLRCCVPTAWWNLTLPRYPRFNLEGRNEGSEELHRAKLETVTRHGVVDRKGTGVRIEDSFIGLA